MAIINSLPTVVDIPASDDGLGVYTGLYTIASQLAAVAGPTTHASPATTPPSSS